MAAILFWLVYRKLHNVNNVSMSVIQNQKGARTHSMTRKIRDYFPNLMI